MNVKARKDNYEIQAENAKRIFLKYDQEKMIRKFNLEFDSLFLYLNFISSTYRVNRKTGEVEREKEPGVYIGGTGYNEVMSIFDVLCCAKDHPRLSGEWDAITNLRHTIQGSGSHTKLFDGYSKEFSGKISELKKVCEQLLGTPAAVGDVSFIIPVFDFLPVMFQFWEGDEEFPSQMRLLWDQHTLDYLHYETTYFIAFYLLDKMKRMMNTDK